MSMLKQRINLLPERVAPKTDWLSFDYVIRACVAIVLVAVLWAAWMYWMDMKTTAELDAVTLRAHTLEQQVKEAEEAIGLLKPDAQLLQRQARLEQRLRTKQRLMTLLSHISPDRHPGFSTAMHDVAATIPEGMWLTRLAFDNPLQAADFSGVTTEASLMPVFFSELSLMPSFRGFNINTLATTALEGSNNHQFDAAGSRPADNNEQLTSDKSNPDTLTGGSQ